jgi:hypothetical protein
MVNVEDEAKKFWDEIEKQRGGKVKFYTFATFLGETGGRQVALGGLMYIIKDMIYFEDFERENWFAKIFARKQKWEKTELSFREKNIEEIRLVSKGTALNCIGGFIDEAETKPISKIFAALFQSVVQIRLKSQGSLFFDIMRKKEFINAVSR